MEYVIALSYGELALKGNNRRVFEDRVRKKVNNILEKYESASTYKEGGKLYIKAIREDFDEIIEQVQKVFGIIYISICLKTNKNIEDINKGLKKYIIDYFDKRERSFKISVNRVDKSFTPKSPVLNKDFGGYVLKNFSSFMKVDIHNPDSTIIIDIKECAYIYDANMRIKGLGGLPIGSSGKGLALLSGGIDSPVAAFLMAKRGMQVHAVHFHSYPFTNERAFEKVKKLAEIIASYIGDFKMYSVNLLDIQTQINKECKQRYMTVISRRFMTRIAEEIAKKEKYDALITGESLGQVASQTIDGLKCTNESVDIPIMRPLIAMDKVDIIDIAKNIGSYETSILPFEDCCTVFLPKRPVTKPRIYDVKNQEENLDVERLISEAIEKMEVIDIKDEQY